MKKYILNGKRISEKEAVDRIYAAVPNGGLTWVKNMLNDAIDEGKHEVSFNVGCFSMIIKL